ncbi:hypothetical protein AQUCO_00200296v1 [Aquilegia coerulea]|uniref:Uncharacterized protein n=1 Tax=Aquilegia coerulea TaxID=218851 RepID=A0A2G5F2L3_AQUCA|nr:hypothetical protein AQUCO_00200296v1 [Aquilegia coerulea]
MNVNRAERLVYVHYNHRLLSRYRNDYEEAYKNWDVYANDDNLDNDIEALEDRENCLLHDAHVSSLIPFSSEDQIHELSIDTQGQRCQEILRGKRLRGE